MIKQYQCVIFDWDGTLIDSERKIVLSIQHAAKVAGMPVLSYDESKRIIGLSLEKAILGLYPSATQAQVQKISEGYSQHFLVESEEPMLPFEGALSLLEMIKSSGAKLAVATGKSRRGLDQIMPEVGFDHLFDMTRTPVESASKPDPLMLQQILDAFELSAEQAIMVGDTEFDLLMAKHIGMDSVAMSHGVHDIEHLRSFDPVVECDDLHALSKWLAPKLKAY